MLRGNVMISPQCRSVSSRIDRIIGILDRAIQDKQVAPAQNNDSTDRRVRDRASSIHVGDKETPPTA
jgi:hypothetical protein